MSRQSSPFPFVAIRFVAVIGAKWRGDPARRGRFAGRVWSVKGRHYREFSANGAPILLDGPATFRCFFGSFSRGGVPPRPLGAPPGALPCPGSIFRAFLVAPGPPFGSPWPPLASPSAPFFAPGTAKNGLRSASLARRCKKEAPGSQKVTARTCIMW